MRAIGLVARAAFRESLRDRIPLTVVAFGVLLVAASYAIGQMTAGQDLKIIKDLGLAALHALGLFIAVVIGLGLVVRDIERRSLYAVLARPVGRGQFIAGKYLGLSATLAVNLAAMTAALYAVLAYQHASATPAQREAWPAPALDPQLVIAVVLVFGELLIVMAVALCLATFARPATSGLVTLGLWVVGHFNADLRRFEEIADSAVAVSFARVLYYVLPNLAPFDVKAEVVHGVRIAAPHVWLTLAYAAVYVFAVLMGAVAIFRRRDLR